MNTSVKVNNLDFLTLRLAKQEKEKDHYAVPTKLYTNVELLQGSPASRHVVLFRFRENERRSVDFLLPLASV